MSSTPTAVTNEKQAAMTEAPIGPSSRERHERRGDPRTVGSSLERVTVNLSPRSVDALDTLVDLTKETKTDAINKALQVYAYIRQLLHDGGTVYVREPVKYELERLLII